jgi:hypothetical protein
MPMGLVVEFQVDVLGAMEAATLAMPGRRSRLLCGVGSILTMGAARHSDC